MSPLAASRPRLSAADIDRHRLDNGLEVVLHPDCSLPLVAVNLWYHVGSKNERPGRTGFAHLFEHMLFQGSQHVGTNDHFAHVQRVGGVANGSTSRDRTNYYETLPSHHLELALWLESDRMGFLLPAMTEEKLENQRQVVMNERLQRVDNQPYGRAGERLHELLFPAGHPYRWPVIGYMEDIAAAELDQVAHFFGTYYRPNNAVLTIAGDFEPTAALAMVERYFAPLPAGKPVAAVAAQPVDLDGERCETLEDDVQLARVYLAYPAPAYGTQAWYAAQLLASVLSDGRSSRLYNDLVYERQVAQEVGAWLGETELPSSFVVIGTARPGTGADELEELLTGHLTAIARHGVGVDELERVRNRTLTGLWEELALIDRRADRLSQLTTYFDDPGRLDGEVDRYLAVSADDLAAAAGALRSDRRAVVTVVPAGSAA